ncbi:hypothetical protein KAR91_80385 [Candidatus Pacearchaeota archaeon]|nr:hypothetical protein [Candidatus Pacearchaeota archaeon]
MQMKIQYKKHILLFIILGATFNYIEFFIRVPSNQLKGLAIGAMEISYWSLVAYTSIWMGLVGGTCGVFLGKLNSWEWSRKLPSWLQSLIGMVFILLLEYWSGMILNNGLIFGLHLGIWDYTNEFLNIDGQICLKLAIFFYLLTPFAFWLEDVLQFTIKIIHRFREEYKNSTPSFVIKKSDYRVVVSLLDYYKNLFQGFVK